MFTYVGQSARLKCQAVLHSRIIWRYTSPNNKNDVRVIYWRNKIFNADRQRFNISQPESGVFDLVINRVIASDAGIYRCTENDGHYPGEACTQLVVIGTSNIILKLETGKSSGKYPVRCTYLLYIAKTLNWLRLTC